MAAPEREDVPGHAVGQAEDEAEDGIRRLRAPLKRQGPEREDVAPSPWAQAPAKGVRLPLWDDMYSLREEILL